MHPASLVWLLYKSQMSSLLPDTVMPYATRITLFFVPNPVLTLRTIPSKKRKRLYHGDDGYDTYGLPGYGLSTYGFT